MAKKKVRVLISIASPDWGYYPGQIVELDADMADKWIQSGIAEPAEADEVETATDEKREVAAKRTSKRK